MSAPSTCVRLTAEQKLALCRQHDDHPDLSLRGLCRWAGETFQLPKDPSPATLLLLFRRPVVEDEVMASPLRKANHAPHAPVLEQALVAWIVKCEQLKMPVVTWGTIRAKAEKIRHALVLDAEYVLDVKLESLIFSDGWMQRLQKCHGLKTRRVHGEAGSAPAAAISEGRERLRSITSKYSLRDILNMDESAYYYCMMPVTSVTKEKMAGRKHIKKRLTVAITTNADGSSKTPLLFIGSARSPRCFKKLTTAELGVDYTNAAKGWMTTEIFRSWLAHFDKRMGDEGRRVLLLLDNASPHRITDLYLHVTLHFLPPNTTAHLQPQDAGIIQAFKRQLDKVRNNYVVDKMDAMLEQIVDTSEVNVEPSVESIYNVDILVAMRWAQVAWDLVTSSTIANCWSHTGIIDQDIFELVASVEKLQIGTPTIRQHVV